MRNAQQGGPVQAAQTPDLNCDKADLAVAPTPPPAAALAAPVVFTAALQDPGAVVKVEPKLKQTTKRNTKLARQEKGAKGRQKSAESDRRWQRGPERGAQGQRGCGRGQEQALGARATTAHFFKYFLKSSNRVQKWQILNKNKQTKRGTRNFHIHLGFGGGGSPVRYERIAVY